MKVAIAGVTLAAIVLAYIGWGLYQNSHKKPLPPPSVVVVAPSPVPPPVVVKPDTKKEADGL